MRWLKPGLAALLLALGIAFCFNWRPQDALLVFYPRPILIFLSCVVLLAAFQSQVVKIGLWILDLPAALWIAVCSLFAFGAATYLAYGPLDEIPHVPDDICYLWQARTFATGQLYCKPHDLPEFFNLLFMVNSGKWYSLFQPGWPAILMLAVGPGLEFVVNPILTGIAVALCYPIGRRALNDKTAKLGMLMLALSPMHFSIGATLLAHTLALVLTEIAVLMVLKMADRDRLSDVLILGFALGWLFATRALNAVALVVMITPVVGWLLVQRKTSFGKLAAGTVVASVLFSAQLYYNYTLTGDPLYWPQDRYFDLTEPKKDCHRLGFGKDVGCPFVHKGEDFPNGFYPSDALDVTHRRLGTFLLTLFGWNLLFFFIGLPFLSERFGWRKYFLLSVFLSLLVGYFFFYFHGLWGRYYFESSFAIFLLVSAGLFQAQRYIRRAVESLEEQLSFFRRIALVLIPSLLASYLIFNMVFFFPAMMEKMGSVFFGIDRRLERMTAEFPPKSIVFLKNWHAAGFILMRPGLSGDKLFVHDTGKHNRLMMQYYPDWNYYRYDIDKDRMQPLRGNSAPSPIFVEAEYKVPIIESSGEFCFIEPKMSDDRSKTPKEAYLSFQASGEGSFMVFEQFVFKDGRYGLSLQLPTGPHRGRFKLSVDGHSCEDAANQYSPTPGLKKWRPKGCTDIELSRGHHRFRIDVLEADPESSGNLVGIDWLRLDMHSSGESD